MVEREHLSGPDNAWRRMGTAENLMTVTGVMSFDEYLEYEEFCDRLEDRLLRFDRFKQRIGGRNRSIRRPYWKGTDGFDIRTHVSRVALPEPADKEAFQRFVGDLISRPLDECRPVWEAYHLENGGVGDGNAVAFRINHCIGDGFALLYVLLGLVDNPGEIDLPMGNFPDPPARDDHRQDGAGEKAESATATGTSEERGPTSPSGSDGVSIRSLLDTAVDGAAYAATGLRSAYRLVAMDDDPETSMHGPIGTRKHVAWTGELDLARIKAIGRAHDTTVNDVLLGATAGGLRRLFEERGEETAGMTVRCTVPVNLKGAQERDSSLGNYFGLAFIPIPVGERDLEERIRMVRTETSRKRLGSEAFILLQLLRIGGHVPVRIQRAVMNHFEDKSMGVFTNVPGPTSTVEFAGNEVADIMFWVPQSLDQGIGISIFSYDGSLRVGVNCDGNLLSDPETLTDAFETEVENLVARLDD